MFSQIRFRKLNTDRKQSGGKDDSHNLQCYSILRLWCRAPSSRIEYSSATRAYDNTERGSKDYFTDIELVT